MNLTTKTLYMASPDFYKVFLRNKWYKLSLTMINDYIYRDDIEEGIIDNLDQMIKIVIVGIVTQWSRDLVLVANVFSAKYIVLQKIAMTNQMAATHRGSLNLKQAELFHRVNHRIPIDIGQLIFAQILCFVDPKEPKVKLHYPSLIYFLQHPLELLESPLTKTMDKRLFDPPHVEDVVPVIIPQAPTIDSTIAYETKLAGPVTALETDKRNTHILKHQIEEMNGVLVVLAKRRYFDKRIYTKLL